METESTVSIEVEIPNSLYEATVAYIESHGWDFDRFTTAAISLRLIQSPEFNGNNEISQIFLNAQFDKVGSPSV